MTIAPEREDLSELDFDVDTPNLLTEPDWDNIPDFEPVVHDFERNYAGYWQNWLCNCSPSRSEYLGRIMKWPEPVTFTLWEPYDEPAPVMSKELVVIR